MFKSVFSLKVLRGYGMKTVMLWVEDMFTVGISFEKDILVLFMTSTYGNVHWTLVQTQLELPVHAEAAAVGVSVPCTHTALGRRPPPLLLSPSRAPPAQGTLVTGHTIRYSVPKKKKKNQTDRKPCTWDWHYTSGREALNAQVSHCITQKQIQLYSDFTGCVLLDCIILGCVSNILSSTIDNMGREYRKHLSE